MSAIIENNGVSEGNLLFCCCKAKWNGVWLKGAEQKLLLLAGFSEKKINNLKVMGQTIEEKYAVLDYIHDIAGNKAIRSLKDTESVSNIHLQD